MRGRRRPPFGPWGAVAAAATIAVVLPFAGPWASSEHEPGRTPAAQASPEPAPKAPAPATPARAPAAPSKRKPAAARRDRVALGAFIPGVVRRPALLKRYVRKTGRRPAILAYYRKWREGQTFDRLSLDRVAREGAVPMITWEPWGQPLRQIAAGRYDAYLRSSARDARRWGRPILLRFAHEMNGDWYPWGTGKNSQLTYVRAWRQVVRIFRKQGADNVRFLWTPNIDTGGWPLIKRLYPGDRWVDWVGLSGFSWGGPWPWESAFDVFHSTYRPITRMTKKPFLIAETSAGEIGGDKARWIERTFAKDLPRMPRVRAVVWFNRRHDWADFAVDSSRASVRAFRKAAADPRYSGTPEDVIQGG
jgi:beta-mannanase